MRPRATHRAVSEGEHEYGKRKNAEALEAAGAAHMILQKDLTGDRLATEIAALAADPQRLATMAGAAKSAGTIDARTNRQEIGSGRSAMIGSISPQGSLR